MRLKDCDLNVDGALAAPFRRSEAEDEWVSAKDSGAIPQSLFDLYRQANYLSFGTAPKFLADADSLLFSYFCLNVQSIMCALVDASAEVIELSQAQSESYYPGKALDDPTWSKEKSYLADRRARNSFRNLLNSVYVALESLAEVIGIFFPGKIANLTVGRAQFSSIEEWVKKSPPQLKLVASPQDVYVYDLYKILHLIIMADGPECDWLPYLRLLRNKSAHLGQPLFRQIGLRGSDGRYYMFLPREWPYLWEKHIKPVGKNPHTEPFPVLFLRTLAHDDVTAYANSARIKVISLIDNAIRVICQAYRDFSDFPFNTAALEQLTRNSKKFKFEHFTNSLSVRHILSEDFFLSTPIFKLNFLE